MRVGKTVKALGLGAVVLLTANIAWLISLQCHIYSIALMYMQWLAPVFAALLTSYQSPRKKILLGLSMMVPATVFGTAIVAFYGDASDFPTIRGLVNFFWISIVSNTFLTALGACFGYYFTHSKK